MPPAAPLSRIGNYTIVRQLGEGAASTVYLAMHEETLALVALKQLRERYRSDVYRSMFQSEIMYSHMMEHKNIVRVLDADMNDPSGPYLVMEYVKGSSLDKYEQPNTLLPLATVLSVVTQIAEALRYAAQQGVVHRDVKPGNIIMMPNGDAKLADFGCAIAVHQKEGVVVAGSLAYMSPEQLQGGDLDQRADIYSLGAVLYRLLTGKHTFVADNDFDAKIAVLNYPIIPIGTYRRGLPDELVAVVNRALRKNLKERYVDWDEFIADLGKASHVIHMADYDMDLYRGFSISTQSALSSYMDSDRAFSRSTFSRSSMPSS